MAAAEFPGRLLVESEPHDGRWNMAFDEALLEAAVSRGEATLRVYRWSEPTLSLGYFQKSPPPDLPEPLLALPRVRRLTGGGAILHHHEWTYSCAVPKGHPLAARSEVLYDAAHEALIAAFADLGVAASLRGEADRAADANFLCFLRGDPRDVLVAGRKVVGSAQRRRRGAVLQHGSVLLRRSPLAPDVPGLEDLAPAAVTGPLWAVDGFVARFAPRLFSGTPLTEPSGGDLGFAMRIAAD
ncbi:MAG TPA: hypothetical protein VF170_14425 [Planctomycetaceae bacterium]